MNYRVLTQHGKGKQFIAPVPYDCFNPRDAAVGRIAELVGHNKSSLTAVLVISRNYREAFLFTYEQTVSYELVQQ